MLGAARDMPDEPSDASRICYHEMALFYFLLTDCVVECSGSVSDCVTDITTHGKDALGACK